MSFGDISKDFLAVNDIGSLLEIDSNYYILINYEEFEKLKLITRVEHTDGSVLILGNSHDIGGITVLNEFKHLGGYIIMAEFEGNEYLSSKNPSIPKQEKLMEINNRVFLKDESFDFSYTDCSKVDLTSNNPPFLIIPEGVFIIINKYSTKKYLNEIITLDLNS